MSPCLGSSPFLHPKARTFIPGTLVTCHIPALPEGLLCASSGFPTHAGCDHCPLRLDGATRQHIKGARPS